MSGKRAIDENEISDIPIMRDTSKRFKHRSNSIEFLPPHFPFAGLSKDEPFDVKAACDSPHVFRRPSQHVMTRYWFLRQAKDQQVGIEKFMSELTLKMFAHAREGERYVHVMTLSISTDFSLPRDGFSKGRVGLSKEQLEVFVTNPENLCGLPALYYGAMRARDDDVLLLWGTQKDSVHPKGPDEVQMYVVLPSGSLPT
jgi:hypothetical protein